MAEEEHNQEDADMPASQVSGVSLQHQQAQDEEQALSALHASVHLHGPAELLATEEEGCEVHALHSSVQLQGAAEPGNTNAEQGAADLPHEACPEAEDKHQHTAGLPHLSLQTPLQLTNIDVFAKEKAAVIPAAERDDLQLFERSARGMALHAGLLFTPSQQSPSQHSPSQHGPSQHSPSQHTPSQ